MKVLHNDTNSEPLKLALDDVTCSFNGDGAGGSVQNNVTPSKSDELYEIETPISVRDFVEDDLYDDAVPLRPEPTVQPVVSHKLAVVVTLPIEKLPCPRELRNGEDSLMLSSKDENFWNVNKTFRVFSSLSLVIILILISVF